MKNTEDAREEELLRRLLKARVVLADTGSVEGRSLHRVGLRRRPSSGEATVVHLRACCSGRGASCGGRGGKLPSQVVRESELAADVGI